MAESLLFEKIGKGFVAGAKSTLLLFKERKWLSEAFSEPFLSKLSPNSIYLTTSTPAERIDKPLGTENMIWVDATGALPSPAPGFALTRVPSARNLVALSSVLGTMISGGNHSFLVVNSLNEILEENGEDRASQFVDFLISRLRHASVGSLFLLLLESQQEAKFAAKIYSLFDDVKRV
ncbi:MAG: hypothetical protein N3E51_05120 [Candidatus Micrarchaeota archaeon]|nr:hypothetical protein [Candidatus Micrarchaeota archaeon]